MIGWVDELVFGWRRSFDDDGRQGCSSPFFVRYPKAEQTAVWNHRILDANIRRGRLEDTHTLVHTIAY